jgi:DNA-binding transcriptional ArsR family regulator
MPSPAADDEKLDLVFGALADPVWRAILTRLDGEDLLVTELGEPFAISRQARFRHIQVLGRAGLVKQERSRRVSRCHLDTGPILGASLWLNRRSHYWQSHSDTLAEWFDAMSQASPKTARTARKRCPRAGKPTP